MTDRRPLVITPTYNERDNLRELVDGVLHCGRRVDLLIVDDSSPDGTGELADELATQHDAVFVVHRSQKQGLGPAYRAGFTWGFERGYDVVVQIDADLSHDPAALPAMIDQLEHADLVIGSRYIPGGHIENWSWARRLLSRAGNLYVRLLTGLPVADATAGYRAYHKHVIDAIQLQTLRSDGYSFQLEGAVRAWRLGYRIREVPITFVERTAGQSKISRSIVFEALVRVAGWGSIRHRGPWPMARNSIVAEEVSRSMNIGEVDPNPRQTDD